MGARVAVLLAEERAQDSRRRVFAVVQEQQNRRGRRTQPDGGQRAQGHGEQGDVSRAVHQPEELQGAHGRGDGVRGAEGGRRQQPDRVLGVDAARTGAVNRQVRVHNNLRHPNGGGELRRAGPGGQGGSQAAADRVRTVAGRRDARVRRVLLPADARGHDRVVPMVAVLVPRVVRGHVLTGRRVHTRRAVGRDVPGERAVALFRNRVHHVGVLLVRIEQDIPHRVPRLRLSRHVLGLHGCQLRVRVLGVQIRDRDHR